MSYGTPYANAEDSTQPPWFYEINAAMPHGQFRVEYRIRYDATEAQGDAECQSLLDYLAEFPGLLIPEEGPAIGGVKFYRQAQDITPTEAP